MWRLAAALAVAALGAAFPTVLLAVEVQALDAFRKGRDVYLQHGDAARAVQLLAHAVSREPRYREAYLLLGTILLETGQPERALELSWRALENLPGDEDLLLQQGEALVGLGRTAEAAAVRDRLRREGSGPLRAEWLTAAIARAGGDLAAAEGALARARAAGAQGELKLRILAALAAVREEKGDLGGAREAHRALLAEKPTPGFIRDYLAFLARNNVGGEDLVAHAGALVEQKPSRAEDYAYLSQGHLLEGRPAEAVYAAAKGLAMGGQLGTFPLLIARGQLALGLARQAGENLERAAAQGIPEERLAGYRAQAQGAGEGAYEGPAISIAPSRWDVGEVEDGDRREGAFLVKNLGKGPLKIFQYWVRGLPQNALLVRGPAEVAAGAEDEIVIEARGGGGPFSLEGQVFVLSNDAGEPAAVIALSGKVKEKLQAVFATEPRSPVNVGEIPAGTEVVREFRVFNKGNKALGVKRVETSPGMTFKDFEVKSIAPGSEARIVLLWTPAVTSGLASGKVAIYSDDTWYTRNDIILQVNVLPRPQGGP